METVAVYWEPIIRTYGFDVQSGLTLTTLAPPTPDELRDGLAVLTEDDSARLVMAVAGHREERGVVLSVVIDGDPSVLDRLSPGSTEHLHPVDVVRFHGPHFGDRYGIATAARSSLARGEVELLLMGCTGASIYLAVPGGEGPRAVQSLRPAFTTPDGEDPAGSVGS